jgi:hypothetical protein
MITYCVIGYLMMGLLGVCLGNLALTILEACSSDYRFISGGDRIGFVVTFGGLLWPLGFFLFAGMLMYELSGLIGRNLIEKARTIIKK